MRHRFCLVSLLLGLFGCSGRVLDLDQAAPASPDASQSDPSLPASLDQVTGVWVDDTRLFWTAGRSFQSCLKADCKHTTTTYATADWYSPTVAGGSVYWLSFDGTVFGCPAEGCTSAPVALIHDHSFDGNVDQVAIDADRDYFYWTSAVDIYRCPVSGCGVVPEVVASDAHAYVRAYFLRVDKTHAYWLDSAGILSAPVDGSETPKLLVPLAEQGAAAVSNGYVYWTARNQVFRCSTVGCGDAPPTLLVTDGSDVSVIKVDDDTMYWLAGNAIHSCQLPGCEQPQPFTPAVAFQLNYFTPTQSFAVDAIDVYWIEARDPHDTRRNVLRKTTK